ncbi:hypothetical protein TrCOL_g12062 [Triparma columacea]|uniref:Uncharacterized protein n=1 Tax=Triparma columacea TaxID=722753 RepID=A0A9W7G316_9STRA|nr:hypothetical protein TrCOL_g12062 [Triparma columacea]
MDGDGEAQEPSFPKPKKRTVDSDSLSPKNMPGLSAPPASLSSLLNPSKGDLLSRLDVFLPAMASANAELSALGAASRQMDATIVRIGVEGGEGDGGSEEGGEEGREEGVEMERGVKNPSSSDPTMIELNVAVGEFDDSLYDKLGLGEKKSEPPSSPPSSSTSLHPSTESFISKKLSSRAPPSLAANPPSSSSPKKKPKIEVLE